MKDVKSTTSFVQALNESLESGALMCQLYNGELNKYVMNLTTEFCRRQVQRGVRRNEYIKKAAECLGRQPDSKIWVLNEELTFNDDGDIITTTESPYIWLGGMIGNRNFHNVAPAGDAAVVPNQATPINCLNTTLDLLKNAVSNNYTASFFVIASAGMALHYEAIMERYGMCPTPIAVGAKSTGKSTAARTAIALLGTQNFFVRDFSMAQSTLLNSRKTFPTIIDDPSDLGKVKAMIDNSFNAGARSTARATIKSRSTPIITLNLDRLKALCSNYK